MDPTRMSGGHRSGCTVENTSGKLKVPLTKVNFWVWWDEVKESASVTRESSTKVGGFIHFTNCAFVYKKPLKQIRCKISLLTLVFHAFSNHLAKSQTTFRPVQGRRKTRKRRRKYTPINEIFSTVFLLRKLILRLGGLTSCLFLQFTVSYVLGRHSVSTVYRQEFFPVVRDFSTHPVSQFSKPNLFILKISSV